MAAENLKRLLRLASPRRVVRRAPPSIQNMRAGPLPVQASSLQQIFARLALGTPSGVAHHLGFFRGQFVHVPVPDRIGNHNPNTLLLQEPYLRHCMIAFVRRGAFNSQAVCGQLLNRIDVGLGLQHMQREILVVNRIPQRTSAFKIAPVSQSTVFSGL